MPTAPRPGCLALLLCAVLPSALTAQEAYPVARIDRTALVQTPAPVEQFTATLRRLHAEGALTAGAAAGPREDLDGLGAKTWLLAHVAEDFRCLSDLGGACPDVDGPHAHLARFIARFGSIEGVDLATIARDGVADLGPIGFDLPILLREDRWLSREEGLLCSPQARSDGMAEVETALTERTGGDLLQVLDRLRGLVGRYNIRAEPRIDATVLTQIEDAILFLPAPGRVIEQTREDGPPWRWREVLLPDGRRGFVAPEPGALLDAGGLSEQVCYDIGAGQARISVHVGGGD